MRLVLLACVCVIAMGGCKSNPKEEDTAPKTNNSETTPPKKKPKREARVSLFTNAPPVEPAVKPLSGIVNAKVISVVPNLRFVVIDFGTSRPPQLQQKLGVYRLDQKVAEIRVSGPFRNTTVAADITAGEVRYGDLVRNE
ncbi:MAG: hypothetical protein ACO1QB_13675 [Verrucomicrobiales bacterium]